MEPYAKILHLGSDRTADIKKGTVIIEEKIDGSLFRMHFGPEGMQFGSKNVIWEDDKKVDGGFIIAVENMKELFGGATISPFPITIYGEFLRSNKHNTLSYDRAPTHNVIVFDIRANSKFLQYEEKKKFCDEYGLEVVPMLAEASGDQVTLETIKTLLDNTMSVLGKEKIEGVVIKNYGQFHKSGYLEGQPIFVKFVREEFKERNRAEWGTTGRKDILGQIIDEFGTEARWVKAVQHLNDESKLQHEPRDIALLIPEIQRDLKEEEGENIKEALFKHFWKEVSNGVIKGFPIWYKERLAKEFP